MNLTFLIFVIIIIITYHKLSIYLRNRKPSYVKHLKTVPMVDGELPFVGHGIHFSKDIIGFVEKCCQKYGKIFRVKIFRTDMIIICDRTLLKEFFGSRESDLSLNHTLNRLFFGNAFAQDENFLHTIITLVRKTIKVKFEDFIPKIEEEANRMINEMKRNNDKTISLGDTMIKFIACTSAKCFLCIELDDIFYSTLMTFAYVLNKTVILTYFFPKWMLRLLVKPIITYYRNKMVKMIEPILQQYRNDLSKNDSMVIRKSIDYVNPETGKGLTNEEVGGIIVCLLYVSSENTALGLSATMTDLAINPMFWQQVMQESSGYLKTGDFAGLFKKASILEACFLESARMNTHIFPLNRYPMSKECSIGEYYIGSAVSVGVCAPIMMSKKNYAQEIYTDPETYDPTRFLGRERTVSPFELMTFGAGTHLCPGREFAKMEIKTAMALITSNFQPFKINKISELNYFSPSAFAERPVNVHLQLRHDQDIVSPLPDRNDRIQIFRDGENCGWLIRGYLSRDMQIKYYNYTIGLSENSQEHKEIVDTRGFYGHPITYYNLVYTNTSNCQLPTELFDLGKKIWSELSINRPFVPNSVYAQLFGENGKIVEHQDSYCDWGVSISLGASCDFIFGNHTILLESGDIFVADFSRVSHAVPKIHDDIPGWMFDDSGCGVKTFGKVRMSIQIRDIAQENFHRDNMMSIERFKAILKSY